MDPPDTDGKNSSNTTESSMPDHDNTNASASQVEETNAGQQDHPLQVPYHRTLPTTRLYTNSQFSNPNQGPYSFITQSQDIPPLPRFLFHSLNTTDTTNTSQNCSTNETPVDLTTASTSNVNKDNATSTTSGASTSSQGTSNRRHSSSSGTSRSTRVSDSSTSSTAQTASASTTSSTTQGTSTSATTSSQGTSNQQCSSRWKYTYHSPNC